MTLEETAIQYALIALSARNGIYSTDDVVELAIEQLRQAALDYAADSASDD